jgi:hypothetical protein
MKNRNIIAITTLLVSVWLALSPGAHAGIHYGIIADFLNTRNDPAFFDIVATSASVRFTVYQPATASRQVTVPFTNQFATSPDLFNLGGSPVALPALVSAETVDNAGTSDGATSAAVLRQRKLILFTPQYNGPAGPGRDFIFPLGDVGFVSGGGSGAYMLVGNPNSEPIGVNYFVNGAAQPSAAVDHGGCVAIRLNSAPAIIAVATTANAIVALAIVGKGQDFAMTLISPIN